MRQVGIIAAAGLFAVKNNIERLSQDHKNAAFLAENLKRLDAFEVDLSRVETNIVLVDIVNGDNAQTMLDKMATVGVAGVPFGPTRIRFMTHLDVTHDDCYQAVDRISEIII